MNIYDIAEKAQVSIATVSRVLNNSPRVSEKTKQKVLKVMQQESYVPNAFARGLGLNSMQMIGVLCTDITDTFYAEAVGNIEKLCKANGKDLVLCCTGNSLSEKKASLHYMVERRVDAVILIGSAFKEEIDNSHIRKAAESVPVIIINGFIDLPNVYCVVCDECGAMHQNVSHLQQAGFQKPLYLYNASTYSGNEKLTGYLEGCAQCNPQFKPLAVQVERTIPAVQNALQLLLQGGTDFDSVLTSEDIIAAAALNTLQKAGKKLPVIGFNNSVIAECTHPALTSVDNLITTMCEIAVRLLINLEQQKNLPGKTVISARLVERETFQISCKK